MAKRLRNLAGLRDWSRPPCEATAVIVPGAEDLASWAPGGPDDEWSPLDQTAVAERAWARRAAATAPLPGDVVELGAWLGAMTWALAEGLAARADPPDLHVYDTFAFHDQAHVARDLPGYAEGASFRHLHRARTAPHASRVVVHEGPVERQRWDPSRPVGLLVNDISKTWATWRHVRRSFYAALVPGSLVLEQDFAHARTPWLHLSHHRWRDCFRVVGAIPGTSSVVFELVRPLDPASLERDDVHRGFGPREVQAAFDWAEAIVPDDQRDQVRAARIWLHLLHGELRVATDELLKARRDGLDEALVLEALDELQARRLGWLTTGATRPPWVAYQVARTRFLWLLERSIRIPTRVR